MPSSASFRRRLIARRIIGEPSRERPRSLSLPASVTTVPPFRPSRWISSAAERRIFSNGVPSMSCSQT